MSLGPELLNDPDAWGPWYYFPIAIFLFLTIFFIMAFVERHLYEGIIQKFRNAGTWIDFNSIPSLKWHIRDQKAVEGYHWLANNTEENVTVLAWWDYADAVEEFSHRKVVIKEASRNIKNTIDGMHKYFPWSWVKYELWYPFESKEKVRDVATFFSTENELESIEIAGKYNADYVVVLYPWDVYKFRAMVFASGKNPEDYVVRGKFTTEEIEKRTVVKKETIGMKMIYGDEVEGFEKVFDNERMRIYTIMELHSGCRYFDDNISSILL